MGRSWRRALGFEVYLFCRGEQLVPLARLWQNNNHDLCFSYQVADFSSLGHFLMFRNVIVFPPPHFGSFKGCALLLEWPRLYLSREAQGRRQWPSGGLSSLPPRSSQLPIHQLETVPLLSLSLSLSFSL